MPRLPIQALNMIDPSDTQDDWDAPLAGGAGRGGNNGDERRAGDEPRVHRFNAGEALDRKRADRRKSARRGRR